MPLIALEEQQRLQGGRRRRREYLGHDKAATLICPLISEPVVWFLKAQAGSNDDQEQEVRHQAIIKHLLEGRLVNEGVEAKEMRTLEIRVQ